MTDMPPVRCPICGRRFVPEQSPARPFCSQRCRLVDLGRWLDERYPLSGDPEDERDDRSERRPAAD